MIKWDHHAASVLTAFIDGVLAYWMMWQKKIFFAGRNVPLSFLQFSYFFRHNPREGQDFFF